VRPGFRGSSPNFIEEDGAAVRRLEAAEAALQRAGERSFFVPKQLGGNERRRNGGAVHGMNAPLARRERL